MVTQLQTLVLIDDDNLIQAVWKMCAKSKGHLLQCFSSEQEFMNASVPVQTPIYVDLRFRNGEDGRNIAKKLFDHGYKNLFITTGMNASTFQKPTEVLEIIGKEYPY